MATAPLDEYRLLMKKSPAASAFSEGEKQNGSFKALLIIF
jgi:hypothetical protein